MTAQSVKVPPVSIPQKYFTLFLRREASSLSDLT